MSFKPNKLDVKVAMLALYRSKSTDFHMVVDLSALKATTLTAMWACSWPVVTNRHVIVKCAGCYDDITSILSRNPLLPIATALEMVYTMNGHILESFEHEWSWPIYTQPARFICNWRPA